MHEAQDGLRAQEEDWDRAHALLCRAVRAFHPSGEDTPSTPPVGVPVGRGLNQDAARLQASEEAFEDLLKCRDEVLVVLRRMEDHVAAARQAVAEAWRGDPAAALDRGPASLQLSLVDEVQALEVKLGMYRHEADVVVSIVSKLDWQAEEAELLGAQVLIETQPFLDDACLDELARLRRLDQAAREARTK